MVRITLVSFLFLVTFKSYSQKIATTYYDSSWLLTTKEYCEYFRLGIIDTVKYQYYGDVKDFYKTGKLQMKGKYQANIKIDTFYFYFPNGNLKTKGLYKNNIRFGIWTNYYDNGKIKDKIVFNDAFIAALEYYDEQGNAILKNGIGPWETIYVNDYIQEEVTVKGAYKDTLRTGTWNYYSSMLRPNLGAKNGELPKPRLQTTEIYEKGKFIKGTYYSGGGAITKLTAPKMRIISETTKFQKTESWQASKFASIDAYPFLKFLSSVDSSNFPIDELAQFPGGPNQLYKSFTKNLKFSEAYKLNKNSRTAYFEFIIDEKGKLKVTKGLQENPKNTYKDPDKVLFYEKVAGALQALPEFIPAKRNNKYVESKFSGTVILEEGNVTFNAKSLNRKNISKN